MSEREIRATLCQVMHQLEDEASARGRGRNVRGAVFPLILGAGLAVTACDGDESTTNTGSSTSTSTSSGTSSGTGGTGGSSTSSGTGGGGSSTSSGTGGAGASSAGGNGGNGGIGGPVEPPYMAPDV